MCISALGTAKGLIPTEQGPPPVGATEQRPPQLEIVLGHTCIKGAQWDRTLSGHQPLPHLSASPTETTVTYGLDVFIDRGSNILQETGMFSWSE